MNFKILYKNILKNKLLLISTFIIIILIVLYLVNSDDKQKKVKLILKKYCNITINGNNPQDIIVTNDKFYNMILANGELGLAESYMFGYWYSNNLYETINLLLRNYDKISLYDFNFNDILTIISNKIFNRQTIDKALVDVQSHYDIGNDLYTRMLDKNMQYTCGFWQDTNDLDTAQLQKMKIIGQKLNLKQGDTLLDIGCGWGYLINFLSKEYNVKGIGITLSEEQLSYAKNKFKDNKNADYQLMDYRNIPKDMKFNKIVSVGMLEHVGAKNYKEYFDVVNNHLEPNGLALIHTIGRQSKKMITTTGNGPFIDKYIFPGGHTPSWEELSSIISNDFFIHDWHNFGQYYTKTLLAWHKNINTKWNEIPNYNEKFKKMWEFYLLGCAAAFNNCRLLLWQILISKDCISELPRRDCLIKY